MARASAARAEAKQTRESVDGAADGDWGFEDAVTGADPAVGRGGSGFGVGDEQDGAKAKAGAANAGVGVVQKAGRIGDSDEEGVFVTSQALRRNYPRAAAALAGF
jgi:hypothetical protein